MNYIQRTLPCLLLNTVLVFSLFFFLHTFNRMFLSKNFLRLRGIIHMELGRSTILAFKCACKIKTTRSKKHRDIWVIQFFTFSSCKVHLCIVLIFSLLFFFIGSYIFSHEFPNCYEKIRAK